MRHLGNSVAARVSLAIVAVACGLTGCAGQGSNPNDIGIAVPDETGVLRRLRSASELEGLLKPELRRHEQPVVGDALGLLRHHHPRQLLGARVADGEVELLDAVRLPGNSHPMGAWAGQGGIVTPPAIGACFHCTVRPVRPFKAR
jgi:hypothetical protein